MPKEDENRDEVEVQESCDEYRKESWLWKTFCASLRAN